MIIALDLLPGQLEVIKQDLLQDRVSVLLRSHRRGCNFVIITRDTGNWLLNNVILIERDRSTLKRILEGVTQYGGLVKSAPNLIRIDEPTAELRFVGGGEYRVPIDAPDFEEITSKPAFVVEDIQADLCVYESIFRNMPAPFNMFPVGYEAFHGGGQNAVMVAEKKAKDRRIVCMVLDADCRSPFDKDRRKNMISQIAVKSGWPLFFCTLTPCSELENLFGLEVICHLGPIKSSATFATLLRIHEEEIRRGIDLSDRFHLYFDMKEGLSESTFERITDTNVRRWIVERLLTVGIRISGLTLLGFGHQITRQTLSSGECMAELRRVVRSTGWQEVFGEFVTHLMWVLAAPRAQRT